MHGDKTENDSSDGIAERDDTATEEFQNDTMERSGEDEPSNNRNISNWYAGRHSQLSGFHQCDQRRNMEWNESDLHLSVETDASVLSEAEVARLHCHRPSFSLASKFTSDSHYEDMFSPNRVGDCLLSFGLQASFNVSLTTTP